ncbi:MAG: hypothetical protein M9962_15725 [Oligoflexia bacterium]|nr:hypothetical protein [Oligoflexia bacterium]
MSFKLTYFEDFLSAFLIGISCVLLYNLWGLSFDTWYLREDSWIMAKGNLSFTDIIYFFIRQKDDLGYPRPIKDFFFGIPLLIKADPIHIYRIVNFLFFLANGVLLSIFSFKLIKSRIWAIAVGSSYLMMVCHIQPVYWLCAMHTTSGIFFSLITLLLTLEEKKISHAIIRRFSILIFFWMTILSRELQIIISPLILLLYWHKNKKILWEIILASIFFLYYYLYPLYDTGRIAHATLEYSNIFWSIFSYISQCFQSYAGEMKLESIKPYHIGRILGFIYMVVTFVLSICVAIKYKSIFSYFFFIGFFCAILVLAPFYQNWALEYGTFIAFFVALSPLVWLELIRKLLPNDQFEKVIPISFIVAIAVPIYSFHSSFANIQHLAKYMHKESAALKTVITEAKIFFSKTPRGSVSIIKDIGFLKTNTNYTLVPVFFHYGLNSSVQNRSVFIDPNALPQNLIFPKLDPSEQSNMPVLANARAFHYIYAAEKFWTVKN